MHMFGEGGEIEGEAAETFCCSYSLDGYRGEVSRDLVNVGISASHFYPADCPMPSLMLFFR